MKTKTIKPKLLAERSIHIDALHCGSTVGYRLGLSRYNVLTMGVRLTDCTKTISWEFDDYAEGTIEKFDRAIAILQEARRIWTTELYAHNAKKRRRRGKKS